MGSCTSGTVWGARFWAASRGRTSCSGVSESRELLRGMKLFGHFIGNIDACRPAQAAMCFAVRPKIQGSHVFCRHGFCVPTISRCAFYIHRITLITYTILITYITFARKLRSMQSALQKHPKFRNPAYPEGKKYDKALRMVEGAIYSKV